MGKVDEFYVCLCVSVSNHLLSKLKPNNASIKSGSQWNTLFTMNITEGLYWHVGRGCTPLLEWGGEGCKCHVNPPTPVWASLQM